MASCRVAKPLHLKQANLVEAACEDIDDMPVMSSALGEVIIKLGDGVSFACRVAFDCKLKVLHLQRLLVVLGIIAINVMV